MNHTQLRAILIEIYGKEYGAGRKLSKDIGIGEITISRWICGKRIIPKYAVALFTLIHYMHRKKIRWKKIISQ